MAKALIGCIGSSGFYDLEHLKISEDVYPETGLSAKITRLETPSGFRVAFLALYGIGYVHSPLEVPSQANITALKFLDIRIILAFSAVGSLREEIYPHDFIIPDQIIYYTKGIRKVHFLKMV